MSERLGILGGSFNPVHLAHLMLAQEAWYRLQLNRVIFVPLAQNPLKPEPPTGTRDDERLAMLKLALEHDSRFDVDAQELRRGGLSYTIHTLQRIAARHSQAELYLLLGADSALSLPQWKDVRQYRDLCTIVVCNRPGEADLSAGLPRQLAELELRYEYMPLPQIEISASEIRKRVRMGKPVRYLVRDAVAEYIHLQSLYVDK